MRFLLIISFIFLAQASMGQSGAPQQMTPELLQKITAQVNKDAAQYKAGLNGGDLSLSAIQFRTDTFMLEQLARKRMNIDYSTAGMNMAMDARAKSYDGLLNKYYNLLLGKFNSADKKILVAAQRSWLAYRDSEKILIAMLAKVAYSGGGSIQSLNAGEYVSAITIDRLVQLFKYYDAFSKN